MLVYRVENSKGKGPWAGQCSIPICDATEWHPNRNPGPYDDEPIARWYRDHTWGDISKYHFGVQNIALYNDWFRTYEQKLALHNSGFSLNQYEVDYRDAVIGDKQVIFRKNCAMFITSISCIAV